MRHSLAVLALVLAGFAGSAHAQAPWVCRSVEGAEYCTWTEDASDLSEPLYVSHEALMSATGSGDFRIYTCDSSGAILNGWVGVISDGVDCDPDHATCGSVLVKPHFWCTKPTGVGASAYIVIPKKD